MLSIIMTVYNDQSYVAETIESILDQTFKKFEFIIIDDYSTDKTLEILKKYEKKDQRIKVYSGEKLGRAKALSKALKLCNYDFVANIDSDDPSFPRRFEKQMKFLEENIEISLVGSSSELIDSKGNSLKIINAVEGHQKIKYEMGKRNPISHTSVMFRKNHILAVGGYNIKRKKQIDKELWIRVIKNYKVENLREVLTKKRIHENQFFEQGIIKKERIKDLYSKENTILLAIKELELPKILLIRYFIKSLGIIVVALLPFKLVKAFKKI